MRSLTSSMEELLEGALPTFELLYSRIYNNLKPGGWVEIQEYDSAFFSDDDPTLSKAPNCLKWGTLVNFAGEKSGRIIAIAHKQKQKLIEAGFEDVHDDVYKVCLRLNLLLWR